MPAEVANPVERYIELAALETMLTSGLALGQFFDDHIKTIDSLNDDHIDVKAGDNATSTALLAGVFRGGRGDRRAASDRGSYRASDGNDAAVDHAASCGRGS